MLTMPTAPAGSTSDVYCAAGDLVCELREWTSGTKTDTADMTGSCFSCTKGDTTCAKTDTAKFVNAYDST